ncbi:hypothetical protein MBLNU459_g7409t3 [Dothideomycetes sp. NU459]
MSLTFKLASLVIRTVAKPVGNYIKRSAREHEYFRKRCVGFAQGLHRIDMRMRLGILHDAAAQERMHAREAAEAAARKKRAETPTVKTEAQQKAEEAAAAEEQKDAESKEKSKPPQPKIRPLSESRAIELGANFLAESFIFGVAAGLLVWDQWRTRRKESNRREGVEERLDALEEAAKTVPALHAEIERLKSAYEPDDINPPKEDSALSTAKGGARQEGDAERPEAKKASQGKLEGTQK